MRLEYQLMRWKENDPRDITEPSWIKKRKR
jgi:hypothetical protein